MDNRLAKLNCERVLHLKRGKNWITKFKGCPRKPVVGLFKIPGKEGNVFLCQYCVDKTGAIPVPLDSIGALNNDARPRTKGKKKRR